MRRHVVLALLGLALALTLRRPAHACQCSLQPRTRVEMFSPRQQLPTNGRIRLYVEANAELAAVSLRRVGTSTVVATTRRWLGAGDDRFLELSPVSDLIANRRYQVTFTRRDGKREALPDFVTAAGPDQMAPQGGALTSAHYYKKASCTGCCTQRPYAKLSFDTVKDGDSATASLLLAVWTARDGAALDLERAPDALISTNLDSTSPFVLGPDSYSCPPKNFTFPPDTTHLRLIFRTVDRAGHYGPPTETTLDLSSPEIDPRI